MIRTIMKKIDNMQKQMVHVSREMEILSKNQKEILGIKNTITNEESLMDLLDCTQLRKESLSYKIAHWKPAKRKSKENKDQKK